MAQCTARTTKGTRCKNRALPDEDRCRQHLDAEVGRRPLLEQIVDFDKNETMGARICRLLHAGVTVPIAAQANGISERALQRWIAKGREHDPGPDVRDEDLDERRPETVYIRFARQAEKAKAEGTAANILAIATAASKGNAAAAQWLLQNTDQRDHLPARRKPRHFGPRRRHPRELTSVEGTATSTD